MVAKLETTMVACEYSLLHFLAEIEENTGT